MNNFYIMHIHIYTCSIKIIYQRRFLKYESFPFKLILFYYYFFWPRHVACGILVPRPGIESGPLAVKVPRPNHRTTREFPTIILNVYFWE